MEVSKIVGALRGVCYTATPTTLSSATFACCTFFTSCTLTRNVPPFSYTLNFLGCACTARNTA